MKKTGDLPKTKAGKETRRTFSEVLRNPVRSTFSKSMMGIEKPALQSNRAGIPF